MIAVEYAKKKLCQLGAIALGSRDLQHAVVAVSVKSATGYVLLEANFKEVVYSGFGVKHVIVNMDIIDNERNMHRVFRSGLRTNLLSRRYSHTNDEQYGRQYHALRFAEKLNA